MVTPEKIRQARESSLSGQLEKTEHSQKQSTQGWKSKNNPSSIGSSKVFEALAHVVPPPHHHGEVHANSTVSHETDFAEGQTERVSIDVPVTHNRFS